MKIKLRIPEILTSDKTDEKGNLIEPVEFMSQGNNETAVERGGVTETNNSRYADWLIREHGFEILETVEDETTDNQTQDDHADEYPAEYPGRKILTEAKISREMLKTLSREQLLEITGIGEKTADAILLIEETNGGAE